MRSKLVVTYSVQLFVINTQRKNTLYESKRHLIQKTKMNLNFIQLNFNRNTNVLCSFGTNAIRAHIVYFLEPLFRKVIVKQTNETFREKSKVTRNTFSN